MDEQRKIIYVGAKPDLENNHPGGQSTAAVGILTYAERNQITLKIVDTARETFPKPTLASRLSGSFQRSVSLTRLLRPGDAEGVLIYSSGGASFLEKIWLAGLCRLFRVPSLLFVVSGHFMVECARSTLRRRLYGLLLKIPTYLGAQGEKWVALYSAMGATRDRIVVIRNWVQPGAGVRQTPKQYSPESGRPLTFLFVGWLVQKKGVLDLMEAIRASPDLQRCRVFVAGNGDLYDKLVRNVREYDLDHVELLGWQDQESVRQLMSRSDVFVLPTYAEGFPNALLEAMSHGMPVISCPVGAIEDSARRGENALLVEPGDVDALRQAMESFVHDPAAVERFSRRSIELTNELHDFSDNLSRLFNVFRSPVQN